MKKKAYKKAEAFAKAMDVMNSIKTPTQYIYAKRYSKLFYNMYDDDKLYGMLNNTVYLKLSQI